MENNKRTLRKPSSLVRDTLIKPGGIFTGDHTKDGGQERSDLLGLYHEPSHSCIIIKVIGFDVFSSYWFQVIYRHPVKPFRFMEYSKFLLLTLHEKQYFRVTKSYENTVFSEKFCRFLPKRQNNDRFSIVENP